MNPAIQTPGHRPDVALSLLNPDGTGGTRARATPLLSDTAARDLEIDRIASDMARSGLSRRGVFDVLCSAPVSREAVRYRQDVVRDIWDDPELAKALAESIRSMEELVSFSRSAGAGTHPLLESVWRLSELELYVELVERLSAALHESSLRSAGLTGLRDELDLRRTEETFRILQAQLPSLRAGLKLRRSVTIAVNLDDRLRPVEAALMSVNEKSFEEQQFLSRFFGAATSNPYVTRTRLHRTAEASLLDPSGSSRERLPLSPLFQELETVLRSVLRPLAKTLREYVTVTTGLFASLLPEIAFLSGAVAYLKQLPPAGLSLCFPELADPADRRTEFEDLYNLRLATQRLERAEAHNLVGNAISMDEHARVFVLTGPNGGGKTTFTQAVGIAVVFAQSGLPVPAKHAVISPVDTIMTHFPVEEDYDDDLGRFEDEVRRVADMFESATEKSLVLLNEPLTSTGPGEAIQIAADVLAGFSLVGARGIFTTHFHQVARDGEALNGIAGGRSRIGSLCAGVQALGSGPAARTYRIVEGPPEGSSHAQDVARRFGIDLESLRNRIDRTARS